MRSLETTLRIAFSGTEEETRRWIRRAGPASFRVLRSGGGVVACLDLIAMGQWFGGRRVPMVGVAGVAVLPEHRAAGHGSALMREALREMAADRIALSCLNPATEPVYRRTGYEQAGVRSLYTVPVESIGAREREPLVRPARPSDTPSVRRLQEAAARAGAGLLSRPAFLWDRALGRLGGGFRVYVVGDGRPEGYFVLRQEKRTPPGPPYDLYLHDHAFATPAAGRRILSFLAAHRSLAGDLKWHGGPADPLLALLGEQHGAPAREMRWMLRVVDVDRALAARGYPPGLAAEVHLEVEDPLLPRNAGRRVLRVSGGRGRTARGGRGTVRVTVNALAAIYSGFRSPAEQVATGGIEGPAADLAALGAVFAGPAPWMREMF